LLQRSALSRFAPHGYGKFLATQEPSVILGSSRTFKIFLAYVSGGKSYGQKIAIGLSLSMATAVISMLLFGQSPQLNLT
jgi:hypothetical protein